MRISKILQNQDSFSTDEYRRHATPLVVVLENSKIFRWVKSWRRNGFFSGLLMYLFAPGFDVVVTVGHRPAMVFGLLNRLFPRKNIKHVAKEFFFEDKGLQGWKPVQNILAAFYRYSIKNVDAIIVNASGEIKPYAHSLGLSESQFRFIPWPSNINEPIHIPENDNSILAVGRSLRDWNTFFQAVEGLDRRCVVVASKRDIQELRVPANVELHLDIGRDTYLELLKKAMLVVIPLVETKRSTGQASFLEAMAFGKPVIVADVVGATDYIIDGLNGITYFSGVSADLSNKISGLIGNTDLRNRIAGQGLLSVLHKFNKKSYAQTFLRTIADLP